MSRYNSIALDRTETGTTYLAPVQYPEIEENDEDIYIISSEGDRFDRLAYSMYGNVEYWWIIAAANPDVMAGSLNVEPGIQIRIPSSPEKYMIQFEDFNKK